MICQQLTVLLGMACHPLDDAGSVALIETPFRFADGDSLPVLVEHVGQSLRFFDDGGALMHFLGRGIKMDSANQTRFLRQAALAHGAAFTDQGELEIWATEATASSAFAKYMEALLALVHWEREHSGVSQDAELFVEEVALCLAAWKGVQSVERKPKVTGITGRVYELDFDVDGTKVLAISAHHQSASSALHKLVDIRGLPSNHLLDALVVIDDRADPEAAKSESIVLGSVGRVMGMQQLQTNAGAAWSAVH